MYPLGARAWRVLLYLYADGGEVTSGEIAGHLGIETRQVSTLMGPLQRRGLVEGRVLRDGARTEAVWSTRVRGG